jgi:hypothetical protein
MPATGFNITDNALNTKVIISSAGLTTFQGFGSHSFSAGGTGYNKLTIRNTTAGAANGAQLSIGTNADPDQFYVQSFATTFTTSGMNIAGGAVVNGEGPGGLSIAATQSNIGFYTNGAGSANERMRITSGGNVLIGTSSDNGNKFQIYNGSIQLRDATSDTVYLSTNTIHINSANSSDTAASSANLRIGNNSSDRYWNISQGTAADLRIYNFNAGWAIRGSFAAASGVYTALSDINQKKDFEPSILGLDAILGLKPTLYRMKSEDESTNKQLGFIAQEVKEFIPQAYTETGNFIGLNYNAIVAALVKAIQELNERLNKAGL